MPEIEWFRMGVRVFAVCPDCGLNAQLDHDVADDGTVTPSLDCPECEFHAFVKLKDWEPG